MARKKQSRNRRGTGSVTFHPPSGRWQARLTDPKGKRVSAGYGVTAREATEKLITALSRMASGEPLLPRSQPQRRQQATLPTLRTAIETYWGKRLRDEVGQRIASRTYVKNLEAAQLLGAAMLDVQLDKLTRDGIEARCGQLRRQGKSSSYVAMMVRCVKTVLADAASRGLIGANPLDGLRVSRTKERVGKPLTSRQVAQILRHVRGDRLEALWCLMMLEGLGYGEVAGLRWSHVHLDHSVPHVWVREAVSSVKGTYAAEMAAAGRETGLVIRAPKTEQRTRPVALLGQTVRALRELQIAQPKADDHVFVTTRGGLLYAKWVNERWHGVQDAIGMSRPEHVRPHDGRTTMATLAEKAQTPAALSARLGHIPPGMTGHYQHPDVAAQLPIVRWLAGEIKRAEKELSLAG